VTSSRCVILNYLITQISVNTTIIKQQLCLQFIATCFDSHESSSGQNYVCNITVLILGFQNEHSDIANKYISGLKMTHVSRNMSL